MTQESNGSNYQEDYAKLEAIIIKMLEHVSALDNVDQELQDTLNDFVYEVVGQVKYLLTMYDQNIQEYNQTLENMDTVIDELNCSKGVKASLKDSLPKKG
jgi:hypothetical protein